MEEEVKRLSKSLGGFCNHLQSSCDAFNQSLTRRPIPLGLFLSLLSFPFSLNPKVTTFIDSVQIRLRRLSSRALTVASQPLAPS